MKYYAFLLLAMSSIVNAAPTPFPVFLKMGFSSVLDFEDAPTRVVLGDGQAFQVEHMERSLVIRALTPYGTSDMFVYFKHESPRLFILTSSEDAEPTYYKTFESQAPKRPALVSTQTSIRVPSTGALGQLVLAKFDKEKDYLSVEVSVYAGSKEPLKPKWNWVRLTFNRSTITPDKLWSERREIQKDSGVRARFIFAKPNVPRNLSDVALVIPLEGKPDAIRINLSGKTRKQ